MSGITYEGFLYICYGAAAVSALLLIIAVILFFTLKIPSVIGDLSGATARKAIAQIRDQNEAGGPKTYRPSPVNQERGKITDKISSSGKLLRNPSHRLPAHGTSKLNTANLQQQAATDHIAYNNQTTLLDQNQTAVLDQGQTMVLDQGQAAMPDAGQTMVLDQGQAAMLDAGQTMVLDQSRTAMPDAGQTALLDQQQMPEQQLWAVPAQAPVIPQPVQVFTVDYELTFIHTNERIG